MELLLATMYFANAFNQAQATEQQGKFQRNTMNFSADVADLQAEDALDRGAQEASRYRAQVNQVQGAQRAAFAARGVDVTSGSAADVQNQTRAIGEQDVITIQNNAWREAWGFRAQATGLRSEGRFAQLGANQEARTTLITGGVKAWDIQRQRNS